MANKKTSKLKRKIKVAVMEEDSYKQLFSLRLTPFNVVIFIGSIGILLIAGVTLLIAFTSLREYIPGYPTGQERRMIIDNLQRTDSLMVELKVRDLMVSHMKAALAGKLPLEACRPDSVRPKAQAKQDITFSKSEADSLFRAEVEQEEIFDLENAHTVHDTQLEMMFLYTPMKGIVTNKFGDTQDHFGVDVVAPEGTPVQSIKDGTIVFAEWTVETGYVIQVQHENQLLSIYKHNAKLLKRVGTRVKAGEAIAFVGNSGEQSTGPHLHFELWYAGVPLNPENYISF